MKKTELLNNALKNKFAIPHYNFNSLENIDWILEQCEKDRSPVFLGVSESTIKYMGGCLLIRNLVDNLIKEKNITIPVLLHLDHGKSIDSAMNAINANFDSIMIDLSKEELNNNINQTKKLMSVSSCLIEGEIGTINNNSSMEYTSVDDAIKYTEETKVNLLAPSIGNAHGIYEQNPDIQFALLNEIFNKTKTPLALHGGSGIPEDDIKKCIQNGVVKINFNTELQVAWTNSVREYLTENPEIFNPKKIILSGKKAFQEVIHKNNLILNSIDQVK